MKNPLGVGRHFRNLRRLQQILTVLARHGFGDLIRRLHLDAVLNVVRRAPQKDETAEGTPGLSVESRIRMICESLGPAFIKLGQVMATRPDLIPPRLVLELSKLHDDVPPFPFAEVKEVVEAELGAPLAERFAGFEEQPLAAASIAQVHRATLADGRPVVVKVQRPRLSEVIDTDLDILAGLADLLEERIEELRTFRPRAVVAEFARSLREEIDFSRELDNMQRFRRHVAESPLVVVPEPFPELCTPRIITMERMEGFKLTDRGAFSASGLDPMEVARAGTRVTLQSIFEHGFFHADPHPGNFLVRPDGVLCLLDFGLMGELDSRRVDELLSFLLAVLLNDVDMLIHQLQEMEILDDARDPRRLRAELSRLLERFQGTTLREVDVFDVIPRVFDIIRGEDVRLPTDLLLVMKAVATMEGIATEICPDFRPLDEIRPYLVQLYTKRMLDPRQQSRMVVQTVADAVSLLRVLPRDVRAVLRKLNRGELVVDVRAGEAEKERGRAANRIALAIVVATAMVLSTVLLYYPPGGVDAGAPWAGYLGLAAAAPLLILLLWSFWRSKGF